MDSPSGMKEQLRFLMQQTKLRYPNKAAEAGTYNAYFADWLVLANEVGLARFKRALESCWQHCVYFPQVAEIRAYVPSTLPDAALTYADNACRKCEGSGWELIQIVGEVVPRARRCECWKRGVAAGAKHPVTFTSRAEAEAVRNSPEAKAFRSKLREVAFGKAMDRKPSAPQPYIPTRAELAAEIASSPYLRQKPAVPAKVNAK